MDFALNPGHIHFTARNQTPSSSRPGYQLLATNKQAYNEGYKTFYSKNSFHLHAGPITYTHANMGQYQLQNLALIRRVTLHCGYSDLLNEETLQPFKKIFWGFHSYGQSARSPYNYAGSQLSKMWKSKIMFVRDNLPNLSEWRIIFPTLQDIPWYDDEFDREGWNARSADIAMGGPGLPLLNTDYTVDGAVTLVFTSEELQKELEGIKLSSWDYRDYSTRLLAFTLAFAASMADRRLAESGRIGYRAWLKEVEREARKEERVMET